MTAALAGAGLGLDADNQMSSPPELSPSEWRAVAIAVQDATLRRRVSAGTPGLLARLSRWASGDVPANILADPRLEAVRAFVAKARRDRHVDEALVAPLIQHGFNPRQVEALVLLAP